MGSYAGPGSEYSARSHLRTSCCRRNECAPASSVLQTRLEQPDKYPGAARTVTAPEGLARMQRLINMAQTYHRESQLSLLVGSL